MDATPLHCERFRDELAVWIDGELSPEAVEHLAGCDDCRDLRHDARQVARQVALGGGDYVAPSPDELAERVLRALDAREPLRSTPPFGTMVPTSQGAASQSPEQVSLVSRTLHGMPVPNLNLPPEPVASAPVAPTPEPVASAPVASAPVTVVAAPAPVAAPFAATMQVPSTALPQAAPVQPVAAPVQPVAAPVQAPVAQAPVQPAARDNVIRPRVPRWLAGVGFAAIAAAAASAVVAVRSGSSPTPSPSVAVVENLAVGPWQARVTRVVRAAADPSGGFEVMRPGTQTYERVAEGTTLARGAHVRTDARTRARLDLDDGTSLVLDRATEVELDPRSARTARLVTGSLVADVAHRDHEVARIATPQGTIDVLGTKFALIATDDRTTVRVTRGVVRLAATQGTVEVKPGQEAVSTRDGAPQVSPAIDLARTVSWSELGAQTTEARDTPLVGFGELRAKRPGSTTERDEAVHLASHSVKVRIVGNMARTEIEEVFRNDTGQELEGIYRFPLPPEAQIEGLALDVRDRMEPGAFVERSRAAAIWRGVIQHATPHPQQQHEEIIWVPGPWRDPALLEWQRGGRFELRVFPIPAHGARRVRISYTQTVAPSGGVRRYVYPLPHDPAGSTRVDSFDLDVQVLGHDERRGVKATGYALTPSADTPAHAARLEFAQGGFVPSGDLVVEYALGDARSPMTAWAYAPPVTPTAPAEDPYVALALRPVLPRWGESRPRDYVFVVDRSRSMVGERGQRASRLLGAVVAEMDPRDRFTVLACDTRCQSMPGGLTAASSQGARDAVRFVDGVEPAGASDLGEQVREAARVPGISNDRDLRVVYLGDGMATVGHRLPASLAAEVSSAMPQRNATLTAVALGQDADALTLDAVARAGGGVMVPYVPGEGLQTAALGILESTYGAVLRDPVVTLPPGLTASAPARMSNLRAGSEALVVARIQGGRSVSGEVVLRGTVGGEAFEARYPVNVAATEDAGNAFVPRLYAAARIADLDGAGDPTSRDEVVRLSQRFNVASRHTSLLVLESPAMFRAFGVDQNAHDVTWTGEQAGVSTSAPVDATLANADRDEAAGEDLSAGTLGVLTGTGAAGGGPAAERESNSAEAPRTRRATAHSRSAPMMDDAMGDAMAPMQSQSARAPAAAAAPARIAGGRAIDGMMRPPMQQPMMPRRDPRGGRWMRRVWTRHAALRDTTNAGTDALSEVASRIEVARRALLASPDSRDRHKELFRWLSVAGSLEEASSVANRWATRDPLDADALVRMADVAARSGDRAKAVRILAGTVDVKSDDVAAYDRMAALHERAGESDQACAYRVAVAEIRPQDLARVADAVRCERARGRSDAASRVLDRVADAAQRAQVEARVLTAPTVSTGVHGDITLTASWSGGEDLDVVLIDPNGARVSWQGGRAGTSSVDALSPAREQLGLSRASTGEYLVEVVRTDPSRRTAGPVRGTVTVRALGESRTVSFTLTEARARVARVSITRESSLVPVTGPIPPDAQLVF